MLGMLSLRIGVIESVGVYLLPEQCNLRFCISETDMMKGKKFEKTYSEQCASEDIALYAKHDLCMNPSILRILELMNE